MSKKVVIIDPFSTGRLYSEAFNKKGYECIAVKSADKLPKFYLDTFDNRHFINSKLYSVDFVKDSLDKSEVFAVIAGSETGVIVAEELADYFKVPGNDPINSALHRNKLEMQKELDRNNLKNISTKMISKSNSNIDGLEENKSYVLKPLDSAGSENVFFCQNKKELVGKIKTLKWGETNITGSIDDHYLIQPFIQGDEFVIDMIVKDDEIVVSALCIYGKVRLNSNSFIYKNMRILDIRDEKYNELIEYAKKATRALKYRFGLVHMELIAKNDSHSITNPVMIEAGGRLHGGVAPLIFSQCYEPSLLDQSVDLALYGSINSENLKINEGRVVFMTNSIQGGSINTEDFIRDISCLSSFSKVVLTNNGQCMPLTVDLITCPCLVCLVHEDNHQIEKDEASLFKIFQNSYL